MVFLKVEYLFHARNDLMFLLRSPLSPSRSETQFCRPKIVVMKCWSPKNIHRIFPRKNLSLHKKAVVDFIVLLNYWSRTAARVPTHF